MKFVRIAALAAAFTLAAPALAAPAYNLTTPGSEYGGSQYTLGFEFSVAAPAYIDALGVYDNLGNGLTAPASIGIWDLGGTLLTSASIAAGGGTLDGLFRYTAITPFVLTPGTHYVVGSYTTDLASSLNTNQGGTGSINPLLTVYGDRFSNFNSLFSFPTETQAGANAAWLGGNFNLVSGSPAVPEPASWAMMIGGLGLVGATMRRRKALVSFA